MGLQIVFPTEAHWTLVTQESLLRISALRLVVMPQQLETDESAIAPPANMRSFRPTVRQTLVVVQKIFSGKFLLAQFTDVAGLAVFLSPIRILRISIQITFCLGAVQVHFIPTLIGDGIETLVNACCKVLLN